MMTAVDTNILVDILSDDKTFAERSRRALKQCKQEGSLCACEIVWTETAIPFHSRQTFIETMELIEVEYLAMSRDAVIAAAQALRQYRQNGGKKERAIPDFLVAAHAMTQCERLLTRDRGFYRRYFSKLKILSPV